MEGQERPWWTTPPHMLYDPVHVLVAFTIDWLPDPYCCHVGGQNVLWCLDDSEWNNDWKVSNSLLNTSGGSVNVEFSSGLPSWIFSINLPVANLHLQVGCMWGSASPLHWFTYTANPQSRWRLWYTNYTLTDEHGITENHLNSDLAVFKK